MPVEKKFDVFLSHHSQDKPWVIKLKTSLQKRGIKVWLDKDEIRPGDLFAKALERGIEESKAVALIISPESMRSGWVEHEYYRALGIAINGELQLIPVLYTAAPLPGFLKDRNWVDFSSESEYDEKVELLIWGITDRKPEQNLTDQATTLPSDASEKFGRYLQSLHQVLAALDSIFALRSMLYEDHFRLVNEEMNQLDPTIKLPASYAASTQIIKLEIHVNQLKSMVVDFSRTCPPGDEPLRDKLVRQMELIRSLLPSVSGNSPS